jgi:GAF domain-containing protein
MDDIFLEIDRQGLAEETHFTIGYSPAPDETLLSGIGGVLATVHDITEKVVGERRVLLLRDLSARSADAKSIEEACSIVAETLAEHPKDVPFALLYLIDRERKHARLAAAAGVAMGEPESPLLIDLYDKASQEQEWPLSAVIDGEAMHIVEHLSLKFQTVPPGPWPDPPESAVVFPIPSHMAHQLAGLLVLGVSSRLRLDDKYRGFCELVTWQVATPIANARAYEEEQKRVEAVAELDRARLESAASAEGARNDQELKLALLDALAHEIKSPLASIKIAVTTLLSNNSEMAREQRRELLLMAENSGWSASLTVARLFCGPGLVREGPDESRNHPGYR